MICPAQPPKGTSHRLLAGRIQFEAMMGEFIKQQPFVMLTAIIVNARDPVAV
jgi:hypothetical protein